MKFGRTRTLQSAKYLEKKRKKNIIAAVIACICVAAVITLCVFILRSPILQISTVEFSGLATLKAEDLQQKSLETFQGDYLYFIPKSSTLFYSKKDIENVLIDSFKEIDTLDISLTGLSAIEISIHERQPAALVCDGFKEDSIESDSDENCFRADRDAYVFQKSVTDSDTGYLKYYINSTANTLKIGTDFIKKETFINLQNFIKNIQTAGISAKGILINDDGNYELYIKNADQSVTVIYFDDRIPFDTVSSNLIVFLKNNPRKVYDYINLRFGNNIFYADKKGGAGN